MPLRGGFGEITFPVPKEKNPATTVSLKVQLPKDAPFAAVSIKPVPGWTASTTTAPINPPLTDDDGNQVSEAVSEVTWTADAGGGPAPGEYQSFSINAGPLPENAGSLSFPALQGYDDGSTVSWIDPTVEGRSEPEHPAPTLALAAAAGDPAPGSSTATTTTDGGTSALAVTALVVSIVGL